jgi:DNA-binding SARP family transcriptional activator/TolB-like protein
MLGGISLTDEAGAEVDALLRQPKHVALLAYLVSPRPGTWHKRDSVLGTFWPEHDQARSRSAFRSALYTLRQHLPENAIRSRGDNDLSVDPQLVASDTARMEELVERGDYAGALACYKGEFLPGIYVADAEGFDQWIEQERRRTRALATRAARQLSEQLEASNDLPGAIDAARRNYDLDRGDEVTARRLISLLDASGDRAQAFAAYEEFRNYVYEAFGVRPSAETVALLDAIRTRHEPAHLRAAAPSPVLPTARATATKPSTGWRSGRTLVLAAIPIAVAAIAWSVWTSKEITPASGAKTMVVLPVANETGDPSLDYLASGIGDDLARALDIGSFNIRSAARSRWPARVKGDLRAISRAYNASFLLRTTLKQIGDSLQIVTSVVDGATLTENPVESRSFTQTSITDVESRIAADVAAIVFKRPFSPDPSREVDPQSLDLMQKGLYHLLVTARVSQPDTSTPTTQLAREYFLKAIAIDPGNARAWAGLSSVLAGDIVADRMPFAEGYGQASAAVEKALALDSLQGSALANLGILQALKYNKLSVGEKWIRRAEAAEPGNPEVYLVKAVLYRNAHMWDKSRDAIRFAQTLEPLNTWFLDRETITEFCADNPQNALRLYRNWHALDPSDGLIQGGITRALAMMHRYDEALDSWRTDAGLRHDTAMLRKLNGVRGAQGYWNARHDLGLKRVKQIEKQQGRVSILRRMQAYFAAGDSAKGFEALDDLLEQGILAKFRLPCMPEVDEFRETQRFKEAVARAGKLMN